MKVKCFSIGQELLLNSGGKKIKEIQEQSTNAKLEENYEQENRKSILNIQRRISIGTVLKRITEVKGHFRLDEDFLDTSKENLELFWPYIKILHGKKLIGLIN